MKPKKPRKPSKKPQYYVLELGLDAQIGPAPDGTYPLVRAFARWDPSTSPGTWVPAWSTQFQPGDWIVFRIFDFTPGVRTVSLLDPRIFEVHFLDPREASLLKSPFSTTSPTESNPIIVEAKGLRRVEGLRSAATGSPIGWICSDDTDLEEPPYLPGERAFRFSADQLGRFLFRVLIEVTFMQGRAFQLRTYDHDPEIFVGEGDPPPHRG
jgi:hypothetical protein